MYAAEISRGNPTAFLFLLDQSRSMSHSWGGSDRRSKAQEVAGAVNTLLYTLVMRCSKGDDVRDWFHVGVFGYGASVGPCLGGPLAGESLVPMSRLAESPLRLDGGIKKTKRVTSDTTEVAVRMPVWVEPVAKGETPMCEALALLDGVVAEWVSAHGMGYPPTIIHVTDGGSSDGDPTARAAALTRHETEDGAPLLFNIHLSSKRGTPIRFADAETDLPDEHARRLFRMSSVLPAPLRSEAAKEGFPVTDRSRGFAFNADLVSLVSFLDLGTRASNLR